MTRLPSLVSLRALLGLVLGLLAAEAAHAASLYDSAFGYPEPQGWSVTETTDPPASIVTDLGPEGLHLSTVHLQATGLYGGGKWWSRDDFELDFTQDFAIEVSVRVVSAPNHTVGGAPGWPRPGYGIALSDVNGNFLWVGLGSAEVFLSHTAYGQYQSTNTVHAAFNTTDQHHVYRIERGAGGVGARLRIDGAVFLQLSTLGSPDGSAGPTIYFGDLTYWANSETHTAWIRGFAPTIDVPRGGHAGVLRARTLGGPTGRSIVEYGTGSAGSLSVDVFDPAGRRVDHVQREVAAGATGRFEPAGSLRRGLYFYRVRLEPVTGVAVEATGKLVLAR